MALAILELLNLDTDTVHFNVDIGTNRYYSFRIGKGVTKRNGIEWVDEIVYSTPLKKKKAVDDLFHSNEEVILPKKYFDTINRYIQLFSFKETNGKSAAFSKPVKTGVNTYDLQSEPTEQSYSESITTNVMKEIQFNPPRRISHKNLNFSRQASLEDLLASIIKVAGPSVMKLIGGKNDPSGLGGDASQVNQQSNPLGLLTSLLSSILGNQPGGTSPVLSRTTSFVRSTSYDNRFTSYSKSEYSKPFIFGIDDALIGTMIGPVLQALPQLLNSANQNRLQLKQADNRLMTDLVSDVNRRMILQQLMQNQGQSASGTQQTGGSDMSQLIRILQQLPAIQQQPVSTSPSPPSTVTAFPAVAEGTSLSFTTVQSTSQSARIMLSFEMGNPLMWNGTDKILYNRNSDMKVKVKLSVINSSAKNSLPKAIFNFYLKDPVEQKVLFKKSFKSKDIMPDSIIDFDFTRNELGSMPLNRNLILFGEIKWISSKTKKELNAIGTCDVVFINNYFLKSIGKEVSEEKELSDMKVFRQFWNKVWEAPHLGNNREKRLWQLNATMRYQMLLSPDHNSNGIIETKIIRARDDSDSLTEKTEGRMKSGIELSISELNKLCSLWNGNEPLVPEKLEAIKNIEFTKSNSTEFVYNLKLKGKTGVVGMVWVIPVFKLFEINLGKIQESSESGQVTSCVDEVVKFPLPVTCRIIGLKSN
jgi:hypothetical protein